MASGKEIKISIVSALNAAGIEATKRQVDQMSKSVSKSMADMAKSNKTHWADIKAAWDMGCTAISKAWQGITAGLKSAFKFETQTAQFKTLIGSIDEAKKHMADLKELGDTPPFSLDEFAKASRSLLVMTDGALGYKKSLELVGDAAAATGTPIETMGHAVGRMYAFIRDGQPLSRAVMELRNMGVITPEVAQKLQDLQDAGKSNAEIWAEVETQLGRYKGAMAETEKTGDGLIGAIQSRWDNIVRAFGTAWQDTAKEGMSEVLDKMKEIEEDGTLEVWASKIAEAIREAKEAFDGLYKSMHQVGNDEPVDMFDKSRGESGNALTFVGNTLAGFGSIGAGIHGLFSGEGFNNSQLAYMALHGYGEESDEAARLLSERKRESGEWTKDIDIRETAAANEMEIKLEAATKRKEVAQKRAAEQATREMEEKARIEKQFSEAQKKIDERNAEELAKKKIKEDEKAAKERERVRKREAAEEIRQQQKLAAQLNQIQSEAAAAQTQAASRLQQAWHWYRDKGSMRAQLQEERDEVKAQQQFDKDFNRLQRNHRNWRDATNLSVDEEAVRRVALAREEKAFADEYERQTAEAAERSAKYLEYISEALRNGGE